MTTDVLPPVTQLKPLPTEPRAGLLRALGQREEIETFAADVVGRGLRNVFLLGSGGGLLTHAGLQYLLERRATRFPTFDVLCQRVHLPRPGRSGRWHRSLSSPRTPAPRPRWSRPPASRVSAAPRSLR